MKTFLRILFGVFLMVGPALAIDPGVAKGALQIRGTTIKLTHAYAFQDRKELRILLADREVPKRGLPAIDLLSIADLTRENHLRGLLVQFNQQDQKRTIINLMHPVVWGRSPGTVRNVVIADNRVSGEIENGRPDLPNVEYRATFSAPLFKIAR